MAANLRIGGMARPAVSTLNQVYPETGGGPSAPINRHVASYIRPPPSPPPLSGIVVPPAERARFKASGRPVAPCTQPARANRIKAAPSHLHDLSAGLPITQSPRRRWRRWS